MHSQGFLQLEAEHKQQVGRKEATWHYLPGSEAMEEADAANGFKDKYCFTQHKIIKLLNLTEVQTVRLEK